MALSGNLGFVPLDEVLRLLMRSDQRGSVEVRGEDIRGRIFIERKGVSLATTAEDRDLHAHLVNSGYVDDAFLRKVVSGEASFSDLGDKESALVGLVREITVESLHALKAKGKSFDVTEGAATPYGSPRPFDLEAVLDDAKRRADEWAEVHEVIDDLDAIIRMNREPGDAEEITINREAWRLLCEIGSGASVKTLADRLGTTEFWIARVAAGMTEKQLVVLAEMAAEQGWVEATPQTDWAELEAKKDESWWVEPEEPVAEVEETEVEKAEREAEEQTSRFGQFRAQRLEEGALSSSAAYPAGAEESEPDVEAPTNEYVRPSYDVEPAAESVEEDTEAFLEKVFSDLDSNGQPEEEGHGLLRRRRMGSVLKEADED